ncbi:MAG TPA: hypothetical protein VGV59_09475 [Pyrinomonadaceae bacterium]|nr:hypothetical protein [Pyrinomonadaceae bacterium]
MQNKTPINETPNYQDTPRDAALAPVAADEKKTFVEPAISVPVDVLEATTFFQDAGSGATN